MSIKFLFTPVVHLSPLDISVCLCTVYGFTNFMGWWGNNFMMGKQLRMLFPELMVAMSNENSWV